MKKMLILAAAALLLPVQCYRKAGVHSLTDERGVEINGVVWATRNVGKAGTFAATPEDPGGAYRDENNDPCPPGWHTPGWDEFQSLHGLRVAGYTNNRLGLVLGNRRLVFPARVVDSSGCPGLAREPESAILRPEDFSYRVRCSRPGNVPGWLWLCCDYVTFGWRAGEPVNIACNYAPKPVALPVRCVKDRAE